MIAGRFAFSGLSNYLIMEKVKKVEYEFPAGFDEQAQDLIQKLLVRDTLLSEITCSFAVRCAILHSD